MSISFQMSSMTLYKCVYERICVDVKGAVAVLKTASDAQYNNPPLSFNILSIL